MKNQNQNKLNNEEQQQIDKANHTLALFLFNWVLTPLFRILIV